jgi:hypothetical protein
MRALMTILLALALAGCAAPWARGTPIERETAESLNAVDRQHHRTALLYADACTGKAMPARTCTAWNDFSARYQATYPLALRMWRDAERVGDTATAREAKATIIGLREEISLHTTRALETIEAEAAKARK